MTHDVASLFVSFQLMARSSLWHSSLLVSVLVSFSLHLAYATDPQLVETADTAAAAVVDKRSVDDVVDENVDLKRFSGFRADLGKRSDDEDEFEKRYSNFRADLGKRAGNKRVSETKLRDLGKRLQAFRYDLGKRGDEDLLPFDDEALALLGYRTGEDEFGWEDDKRGMFRADLGKRDGDDEEAELEKRIFRADLGKRPMFRADLGKRGMFRADLGKRAMFRADLGKRAMYRADLGKRMFRADLGKRASSFRADLGKRMFRADLGKRSAGESLYSFRFRFAPFHAVIGPGQFPARCSRALAVGPINELCFEALRLRFLLARH